MEIYRVLKPTGTFHLIEHVKHPDSVKLQSLQTLLTPIQKRIGDGCHLNRNIEHHLLQAQFKFVEKEYFDADGIPVVAQKCYLHGHRNNRFRTLINFQSQFSVFQNELVLHVPLEQLPVALCSSARHHF